MSSAAGLLSTNLRSVPTNLYLELVGARVAVDGREARRGELEIENGLIRRLTLEGDRSKVGFKRRVDKRPLTIDLSGYLILPGLLNAHDHLEFNLFPRLGQGPYSNFEQWAEDIYHPERSPLREHLAVPKPVRLWWGGIKNLLGGVTTVCHHNPYEPEVFGEEFPVRVVRRYGWAHSLALERDAATRFRATPQDAPFIIHLGEGTDEQSRNEIFELDRLGALDARTVIVHGVGLDEDGRARLRERGSALVWCPTSNLFTLGTTLDRRVVRENPRLALGNDSALTAQGDLLDEIRVAREQIGVPSEEVYEMVTSRAAEILRLANGEGTTKPGAAADLIALRDSGGSPASALVQSSFRQIELVLLGGQPQLLSPEMARRWPEDCQAGLNSIKVENVERLIRAPLARLCDETRRALGPKLRLAGRSVMA